MKASLGNSKAFSKAWVLLVAFTIGQTCRVVKHCMAHWWLPPAHEAVVETAQGKDAVPAHSVKNGMKRKRLALRSVETNPAAVVVSRPADLAPTFAHARPSADDARFPCAPLEPPDRPPSLLA